MKVLIAEDEVVTALALESLLLQWGYEPVLAVDGEAAWAELQRPQRPLVALLDWMMPGLDGVTLVRRVRALKSALPLYIIMCTALSARERITEALGAGANDYLTKPLDAEELRARLGVAVSTVELQLTLAERVRELETALGQVKILRGLLPICLSCKNIRDNEGYWHQLESYLMEKTEVRFSHGYCADCMRENYPDIAAEMERADPNVFRKRTPPNKGPAR